jgi:hypothetical protein
MILVSALAKSKCPVLVIALALGATAQKSPSLSALFSNDRLKAQPLKDYPIEFHDRFVAVSGYWVSESKDPSKALAFPMMVRISCTRAEKVCREASVTLKPAPGVILIQDMAETEYEISTWDEHGLVASHGGDEVFDRCESHVLTIGFNSGATSVSDIPTHKDDCKAFKETSSYRLVGGYYWVDTSPGNDMDGRKKE